MCMHVIGLVVELLSDFVWCKGVCATAVLPGHLVGVKRALGLDTWSVPNGPSAWVIDHQSMEASATPSSVAVTPSSVAMTPADEAWGLTDSAGAVDLSAGDIRHGWSLKEARDTLGAAFERTVKKFGGPMQFLAERYPGPVHLAKYAEVLWNLFPPIDSKPPTLAWPVADGTHILHLAQLNFTRLASLKGPPTLRTSLLLADDIITSGFITQDDPVTVFAMQDLEDVHVHGPWGSNLNDTDAFQFGYIKGSARICTLHTLVTLCIDDNIDINKAGGGAWRLVQPSPCKCLSLWGRGCASACFRIR